MKAETTRIVKGNLDKPRVFNRKDMEEFLNEHPEIPAHAEISFDNHWTVRATWRN